MHSMFSRTIAVLCWTPTATIVLVALWSRCPVLEVLRGPYFDAIAPLILASSRLKDATIRIVVVATRTVSERSYWRVSSSFPTVRLRRLRSTPTEDAHSTVATSLLIERQSLSRVSVKERTSTLG